jgi:hypothetical protein
MPTALELEDICRVLAADAPEVEVSLCAASLIRELRMQFRRRIVNFVDCASLFCGSASDSFAEA